MTDFWAVVGRACLDKEYYERLEKEAGEDPSPIAKFLASKEGGHLRLSRVDAAHLSWVFSQYIGNICFSIAARWKGGLVIFGDTLSNRRDIEACAALGLSCFDTEYAKTFMEAASKSEEEFKKHLHGTPRFNVDDPRVKSLRNLAIGENKDYFERAMRDFEAISWRKPGGEPLLLGKCDRGHKLESGTAYNCIPQVVLEDFFQNADPVVIRKFFEDQDGNLAPTPRVALTLQ